MARRKPETLVLLVAIFCTLGILGVFITDLILTRDRELDNGEQRLQRFSLMMAEHTARAYDAIDILLRDMSIDLSSNHKDWEKWSPAKGWEYAARHHSKSLPQLRDLIIFDRNGSQRFISTYFPAPIINVKDRPYFQTLMNGAESASFGPYVGRNSGRYTYALGRRLTDENNQFAGVAFAAMEPGYLQDFCWSNRISDDLEAVLINAQGLIVASCRPVDLRRQSPLIGEAATDALFSGTLAGLIIKDGTSTHNKMHLAVSQVPGFDDLRILAVIPETTLLSNWRSRMLELGTLGLLVSLILLFGAKYIRSQLTQMANMATALAVSHDSLAEKVSQATEELANEKSAAERANKAKSRFLAAASHDLRQPMHALSLFAADLQRQVRGGITFDQARLSEQISSSVASLSQLLDSLLDISRLDVSGIKPEICSFPLTPLFERLNNNFLRAAKDRGQTLRFRPSKLWLSSDPVMIERILTNLISNALRYTPKNGHILVAVRRRGDIAQIEVRDNGIGIAPEHQSTIFSEFYQIDNQAREHDKGLGLGLSIVERLTRALNINITLRSIRGKGTTFCLPVPIGEIMASPSHPSHTVETADDAEIYCIGDSDALGVAYQLVCNWGYRATMQSNINPTELPDHGLIIAADIQLAEACRLSTPNIGLIVLTTDLMEAIPSNAHAILTPIRPAKLRALINQLQKTLPKSTP
jgi:signal transduction histidine kinase